MGLIWGDDDDEDGQTGHDPRWDRPDGSGDTTPQGVWDALFGCGLILVALFVAGCAFLGAVLTW
jgi:hypothetical protein